MRRFLLSAVLLAACADDPVEYAWSWENNVLPEDMPSDCEESFALVNEMITSMGYEIVYVDDFVHADAKARRGKILVSMEVWGGTCDVRLPVYWHEYVHTIQFEKDGYARYLIPEWTWAYETQAYRQSILVRVNFGSWVEDYEGWMDDGIDYYIGAMNRMRNLSSLDGSYFEISRAIFEDAVDRYPLL